MNHSSSSSIMNHENHHHHHHHQHHHHPSAAAALHQQHLVVDLESIPNQCGTAILRSSDGIPMRPHTGDLSDHDANILYQMLLEVGDILESTNESLKSINISCGGGGVSSGGSSMDGNASAHYSVCVANTCVYIVKKKY